MEININTSDLSRIPRRLSVSENPSSRKKSVTTQSGPSTEGINQEVENSLTTMKYEELQKLSHKLGITTLQISFIVIIEPICFPCLQHKSLYL